MSDKRYVVGTVNVEDVSIIYSALKKCIVNSMSSDDFDLVEDAAFSLRSIQSSAKQSEDCKVYISYLHYKTLPYVFTGFTQAIKDAINEEDWDRVSKFISIIQSLRCEIETEV